MFVLSFNLYSFKAPTLLYIDVILCLQELFPFDGAKVRRFSQPAKKNRLPCA